MQKQILLGYHAEYLKRHLPRFGIQPEVAMALLTDLIQGPAQRKGAPLNPCTRKPSSDAKAN
ncbi:MULTISPECIES: hypothetical protein [unclassified Paludibacterium]|uniref:hypothetical protein n=1 Tax=unclassified Paludibacterium TaxID=2618429 RepID=UPI001C05E45C|nr:hypothetical protein [Paludibacterium sp. B53371]BEV72313.1 hypothetical protein THUN1379_17950 [Paludibacterium sp. THUN1379]